MPHTVILNLTPHVVRLNSGHEFKPHGTVARVSVDHAFYNFLDYQGIDCPLFIAAYGKVVGLPDEQEGVWYIVSSMVVEASKGRYDLLVPATGHRTAVRDANGQVYSVPGFVLN